VSNLLVLSSLSKEYVRVPVSAKEAGVTVNPTSDEVAFAFVQSGEPSTWYAGQWETDGTTYYARIAVGPGGSVTLVDGTYDTWVKVTDSPEIPVRKVGQVRIT
jgi:hypothetical protein